MATPKKSSAYGTKYSANKSNIVKTWGIYSDANKGTKETNPSSQPFKLSRTKIDMFLECPLCFYLDRKLGIARPSMPAFTLNVAVDHLLKKEFDIHRKDGKAHPIMEQYGVDAVPFSHPQMEEWRENFVGVQYLHPETNFLVFGAVDDIWRMTDGKLAIVDYKATSKEGEVELEDTRWHNQYRRQMEIYQWLFRKNGFKVSDTGYFVYCNGDLDKEAFDGKLEFEIKIIPYTGDTSWVEGTILKAIECLKSDTLPESGQDCDFCKYRDAVRVFEK